MPLPVTNKVQVFSNQAAIFNHPKDYQTKCSVNAYEFTWLPDWILQSTMYKGLDKMGKIKIVDNAHDQIQLEQDGKIKEEKHDTQPITTAELDNAMVEYNDMKSKELYDLCLSRGLQVEKQRSKDYYIGLLINDDNKNEK